jgi:hypothetical protein
MKTVQVKVWTVTVMDGKEQYGTVGFFLRRNCDSSPTERRPKGQGNVSKIKDLL